MAANSAGAALIGVIALPDELVFFNARPAVTAADLALVSRHDRQQ